MFEWAIPQIVGCQGVPDEANGLSPPPNVTVRVRHVPTVAASARSKGGVYHHDSGWGVLSQYIWSPIPSIIEAGVKGQRIFNLVDEQDRSWHAGVSAWENRTHLNDSAVGIEIVNEATSVKDKLIFPPFNDQQIEAVKQLARNILQRYPEILPPQVVGHSDIAPGRKSDPGAAFPWFHLHQVAWARLVR